MESVSGLHLLSSGARRQTISKHQTTNSPHQPVSGFSENDADYFSILGGGIGVLIAIFIGIRLFKSEGSPDIGAWIVFGLGAVLFLDFIRRIWRILRRARS